VSEERKREVGREGGEEKRGGKRGAEWKGLGNGCRVGKAGPQVGVGGWTGFKVA